MDLRSGRERLFVIVSGSSIRGMLPNSPSKLFLSYVLYCNNLLQYENVNAYKLLNL